MTSGHVPLINAIIIDAPQSICKLTLLPLIIISVYTSLACV